MKDLSQYIEHSNLKSDTTLQDIENLCQEAIKYKFSVVMIPPFYVAQAREYLVKSNVRIGTVIGFPLGYSLTEVKILETELAIAEGVDDIDFVVNIAAVKNNDFELVKKEVKAITNLCHDNGKVCKLIFETGLLVNEEIEKLCYICNEIKVDYAKTSTGFSAVGAKVEIVAKMRKWLDSSIKIKASGGIKEKNIMLQLIEAGADRIGTSSGIELTN